MADRPMSFLPSIKCSTCGEDIEIAALADHICGSSTKDASPPPSNATPAAQSSLNPLDSPTTRPGLLRPGGRAPPPRIDPTAANRPFLRIEPSTAGSIYSNPKTMSPITPNDGRNSPFTRTKTSPFRQYNPPSPDLSANLDSPFPPFPGSKPSENQKRNKGDINAFANQNPYDRPMDSPMMAPISPRFNGGESVMKRMNTIAPGPFDARRGNERPKTPKTPKATELEGPGHKRTPSGKSFRNASGREHFRHPSTASNKSNKSQGSSNFGTTQEPPRPTDDEKFPGAWSGAPTRPSRPMETVDRFLEQLQSDSELSPIGMLTPDARSNTFPVRNMENDQNEPLKRRPTEPIQDSSADRGVFGRLPRRPVPPQSNENNGDKFILFGGAKPPNPRIDPRLNNAPPVPSATGSRQLPEPFHSPTESASSESSYASSVARSQSSKSSAPSSRRPSAGSANGERPTKAGFFSSLRRPNVPAAIQPPLPSTNSTKDHGPESPMDPAIQAGLFSPQPPTRREESLRPNPTTRSPPRKPVGGYKPDVRLPTQPIPEPNVYLSRQPTQISKGICRGCGDAIYGKSIKAADGRLTGRYHKQCFVCQTCRAPFPTADFYVLNNSPYCSQHYHELNNSLCRSCDRGIEGKYLETDLSEKFHPRCFTCERCKVPLSRDYYEVDGGRYCDVHAFRVQKENARLGGGRRFPERRTTRLMMM